MIVTLPSVYHVMVSQKQNDGKEYCHKEGVPTLPSNPWFIKGHDQQAFWIFALVDTQPRSKLL